MEQIVYNDKLMAILLRAGYQNDSIVFFTPDNFSQQLAYMRRPNGYVIAPHVHNVVPRVVEYTNEVLFIRKGRVRIDFYNEQQVYLESRIVNAGDIVLLAHGGHGFVMLEESEIVEVKQGPYAGDADKTRFNGVPETQVMIRNV